MKINWQKIRLRNRVLFDFLEENISIVVILFIFAMFGYWLWKTSDTFGEFGQNFVTEILGVLITILIINQLIVFREEKRKIPHKFVVYDDVRVFISNYLLFWKKAYKESVPFDEPESIYAFFSDEGMSKVWDYLYVRAPFQNYNKFSWKEKLITEADNIQMQAEKIMSRHSRHLPPHIYRMIHQIAEANYLTVIRKIPETEKLLESTENPRNNVLESVAMIRPNEKDYASIIAIYDWCSLQYMELQMIDKTIDHLIEYKGRKLIYDTPPAMITDEVKNQENDSWNKFLKNDGSGTE